MAPIDASARLQDARARAASWEPSRGHPLRVNLFGFGCVGQAFARILDEDPDLGAQVRIVAVSDRRGTLADPAGLAPARLLNSKQTSGSVGGNAQGAPLEGLAADLAADVVIDLLPTDLERAEPSRSLALAALAAGRHIVTAGKGTFALHFAEMEAAALRARRRILGSATVCAGTPVLELLRGAFRGDRIERIDGVLNGSTNFVLSRLESGDGWDEAIAAARKVGILEANPSLDLLGLDAAAKAVILSNHAFPGTRTLNDARVRGIWGISETEVLDACARGLAIRLVARASPAEGVSVAPVALPREHPLVVHGPENVVRIKAERAGLVTLRGPGAGGKESAAAVLSDVLSLAR